MFNRTLLTKRNETILLILCFVALLFVIAIIIITQVPRRNEGINPNGEYSGLRGSVRFQIEPSLNSNRVIDVITIYPQQTAGRVFEAQDKRTRVFQKQVTIESSLWNNIEALRETWCIQPPTTHRSEHPEGYYRVIIRCQNRNPVLYFAPEQLDLALQKIVDITQQAPIETTERLE